MRGHTFTSFLPHISSSASMIVLPNTPCTPKLLKTPAEKSAVVLSAKTFSSRASISTSLPANHAELTQYMLRLEQYLENIFDDIVPQSQSKTISDVAVTALKSIMCTNIPWTNVVVSKTAKPLRLQKLVVEWTIASEIVATIITKAEVYMQLAADLMNDLIEEDYSDSEGVLSKELDQKWRLVAEYYKSAILLTAFGGKFQEAAISLDPSNLLFNPSSFALFDKICNIGIQMSILCKSSWLNRATFSSKDSFTSSNNGVLCRVAIWIFNEVLACQNIITELGKPGTEFLGLNYDKWPEYLNVFFKYVTAYSGLFLSIENYQKSRLGEAIGLINFSLLTLQSKNLGEAKKRGFGKIKNKLSGRKNENFITNLESVTSLDIDKSVFLELSGAVLSDLSLLFDQLVLLHLKFSKENDNLRFDTVADWKDTRADLKWPLGAKIPVSPPKEYLPKALGSLSNATNQRAAYF